MSRPSFGAHPQSHELAQSPPDDHIFQPQSGVEMSGCADEQPRNAQQDIGSIHAFHEEPFPNPRSATMSSIGVFDSADSMFGMEGAPFDHGPFDSPDLAPEMYCSPDVAPQHLMWQQGLPSPGEDGLDPVLRHSMPSRPMQIHIEDGLRQNVSQQFGQITPPDETPRTDVPSPQPKRVQQKPLPATALEKSERARNAANQRHAKSKKNRKDSRQEGESEAEQGGSNDDKQNRYREKNRVAAAKCRQKKKVTMEDLEDRHRNLCAHNNFLRRVEQDLREELTAWKTKALDHAECGCSNIQRYNADQAHQLVFGNVGGIGAHSINRRRQSMIDAVEQHAARHPRHQSFAGLPTNMAFGVGPMQAPVPGPSSDQMEVLFEESP